MARTAIKLWPAFAGVPITVGSFDIKSLLVLFIGAVILLAIGLLCRGWVG